MLQIDRIRMRLPAGFEHRAASIARLAGEAMAGHRFSESRTLDHLVISPIQVSPNATDQEIAYGIAQRIARTLGEES